MKRKLISIIITLGLAAGMAGCGQSGAAPAAPAAEAPAAQEQSSEESNPAPSAEESAAADESQGAEGAAAESAGEEAANEEPAAQEGSTEEAAADGDVAYIKGKGTLIVGITDFAPMDYQENGEWVGFDADMAEKVAEDLGVSAEFVEIDWDNKILELNNKSIDVVWNGMTLTDEVKSAMECTEPYCNNAQVVVVPSSEADKYKDIESLKDLSFAVEAGSAGESAAKDNSLNFTAVPTQADTLMEVKAGTSDASIIDLLMAGAMVGEGTSYEDLTHTVELTEEKYVVGCRKGSDLAQYINDEFKKFAEDGSLETVAKQYGVQDSLVK